MIKKGEYEEALEVIQQYKSQINLNLVSNKVCCICKEREIIGLNLENIHPLKQEQGMWSGGTVEKISFGYNSVHDLESYYIGICDSCMFDLIDENLVNNFRMIKYKFKKYV